jgi:hypothetical protein
MNCIFLSVDYRFGNKGAIPLRRNCFTIFNEPRTMEFELSTQVVGMIKDWAQHFDTISS